MTEQVTQLHTVCHSLVQHRGADGPARGKVGIADCPSCVVVMDDDSLPVLQCMSQEVFL